MKSIVVAYDKNHAISQLGDLPWGRDMPADLRHFKLLTTGHAVIMGRKTYESIGRPLPHRQNIVISHTQDVVFGGATTCHSLEEAYDACESADSFIIGGAQVYTEAIASVDRVYATEIDARFDQADTYFTPLDDSWVEISREAHAADSLNKYDYSFVTYQRR